MQLKRAREETNRSHFGRPPSGIPGKDREEDCEAREWTRKLRSNSADRFKKKILTRI